jgi:hypothetical protein
MVLQGGSEILLQRLLGRLADLIGKWVKIATSN